MKWITNCFQAFDRSERLNGCLQWRVIMVVFQRLQRTTKAWRVRSRVHGKRKRRNPDGKGTDEEQNRWPWEREERDRDRQRHGGTNRQTCRQRQTERETERQTERRIKYTKKEEEEEEEETLRNEQINKSPQGEETILFFKATTKNKTKTGKKAEQH